MTLSNVPNSFSSDDLEKLLENAPEDITDQKIVVDEDASLQERIEAHVANALQEAADIFETPVVHKIFVLQVLHKMEQWHSHVGADKLSEGDTSGVGWLRDAGQLQVAFNIMLNCDLGEDDFTQRG